MKGPISLALHYPHRVPAATKPIDWTQSHTWNFSPIDTQRFPAVALARTCGEIGGALPAIFNASNEVAVQAFVDGQITFTGIIDIVTQTVDMLRATATKHLRDIADVSAAEEDARRTARELIKKAGS
jgi:1-deoxy-D-xylulose-5-phosphate reductoisomerase